MKLPFRDIIYFSSCNQYVEIYTTTSIYKIRESIKTTSLHLPPQFVQCHRTAIINLFFVSKLDGNNVYLTNGTVLPISQKYLEPLREQFIRFLRENIGI